MIVCGDGWSLPAPVLARSTMSDGIHVGGDRDAVKSTAWRASGELIGMALKGTRMFILGTLASSITNASIGIESSIFARG